MTYRGHVKNGVVVLDDSAVLQEGVEVTVDVRDNASTDPVESVPGESLHEFLRRFAGSIHGLPSDFAEQHDHYIHGTPKKQ